jgi:DNA-binding NarL/FixJ family response regulator
MATTTVMIGGGDATRAALLSRAVTARTGVAAQHEWPERAVAAGADPRTRLVVLDGFPCASVLRLLADVTCARPDLPALVVGPVDSSVQVMMALASGAFGYVSSASPPAVIAEAVEALLDGEAVLPRAVSLPLVQHLRSGGRRIAVSGLRGVAELTNREWEVLVLIGQARTTEEIAKRLVVSKGTVRSHVAALVRKLGAADRRTLAGITGVAVG